MSVTAPVDLTNCDREPIHIPGSIQPHGAMLVFDAASYRLQHASANVAQFVGRQPPVGATLESLVGQEPAHALRNVLAKSGSGTMASVVMGMQFESQRACFDVSVHRYAQRVIVELEPAALPSHGGNEALDITQYLIRRIALHTDVESIARAGARLIRGMLGFDRVMVYQFLHNGAGRVIAEAKRGGMQAFLGQHFPASDIPYQARRLYLLNPIRCIGDVGYTPVPLMPGIAAAEPPVDMSFAHLRSVSPIHVEYLQNMGVQASLSISVVVDGELWGLISCHHETPRIIPMPLRIGAELFGQYFSLQVSAAERRAQIIASSEARERLDRLVASLASEHSLLPALRAHLADFRGLMRCDGIGLWADGEWTALGKSPLATAVPGLVDHVAVHAGGQIWHTQELRTCLRDGQDPGAAGALFVPLSATPRDYLVFFRHEEAHNIEWAGEPVKQVLSTPQGERLSPRGSFQTWREEVRGRSTPWSASELAVAEAIRTFLRDVVLRQTEVNAEENARTEQRRRLLNDELNHRVKNIIALVKSIALQTGAHASSVAEYSTALEGRLRALAFAHDQALVGSGAGDLATLLEAEASLHRYGPDGERVTAAGPPVRLHDRAFSVLALVVHEMMTNAAKYGALSTPHGRLRIDWRLNESGGCEIEWCESEGPPVSPPRRDGFGTKLIKNTFEYDLRGTVRVVFDPGGVRAHFVLPAMHVNTQAPPAVERRLEQYPADGTLEGLEVLLVEDQLMIAMDTEQVLRGLGASGVRLAAQVEDALATLTCFAPDVAVLDFNLGSESCEAVAMALRGRGIPFVFATGYGEGVMIPERFRDVPVVRKPVDPAAIAAKIAQARTISP